MIIMQKPQKNTRCKCKLKHLAIDCILQPRQLEILTTNMLFWAQDKVPKFLLIGDTAAMLTPFTGVQRC